MSAESRYPILDESGRARQWLADGRGIAVWTNQEIGNPRGEQLTPADHTCGAAAKCKDFACRRPHWAYAYARTLHDASECLFYAPVSIVKSWHDSPSGRRAARTALEKTYTAKTRTAPIGTVHETYTIRPYTLGSIDIQPEGTQLVYARPDATNLLAVEFRVGILLWSAIDPTPEAEAHMEATS